MQVVLNLMIPDHWDLDNLLHRYSLQSYAIVPFPQILAKQSENIIWTTLSSKKF